jgi:hypothetical protein
VIARNADVRGSRSCANRREKPDLDARCRKRSGSVTARRQVLGRDWQVRDVTRGKLAEGLFFLDRTRREEYKRITQILSSIIHLKTWFPAVIVALLRAGGAARIASLCG